MGQRDPPARPPAAHDGQPLSVEADVPHLVAQQLVADPPQQDAPGRPPQGAVVDIAHRLGNEQHGDGQDQSGQAAQHAEGAVQPRALQRLDACQVKEAAQRAGVPLLLADEQPHRLQVFRVVGALGVLFGAAEQVAALRTLAELEILERGGDGLALGFGELRPAPPRQRQQPLDVAVIVSAPLARGPRRGAHRDRLHLRARHC